MTIQFKHFTITLFFLSAINIFGGSIPCMTYKEILNEIVNKKTADVEKYLQIYIYENTNRATCRNPLTLPINLYNNSSYSLQNNLSLNVFYIGLFDGIYFNDHKNNITSVIDVGSLTNETNDLFEKLFSLTQFASTNFPLIGDLFENIKVRQQRFGGVFQGGYNINENFMCYAQVPFMYQIQYIYADSQEQEKLTDELDVLSEHGTVVPINNEEDYAETFIKNSMVVDYLGLDRACVGFLYKDFSCLPISLELRVFLPTGCEMKYGLIGSDYSNAYKENVSFNFPLFLRNIMSSYGSSCFSPSSGEDSFENIFYSMLRKITDATYNFPFSQKPLALSPSLLMAIDLGKGFSVDTYLAYIYEIPKTFNRYGYSIVNNKLFNLNYADMTEDEAYNTLLFFGEEFLNRMILKSFDATVYPGQTFQANMALVTMVSDISTRLGFDYWYKSPEKVIPNTCNYNIIDNIIFTQKNYSMQGKVFGNLEVMRDWCNVSWLFGAKFEATIVSEGIGKEFGLAGIIQAAF